MEQRFTGKAFVFGNNIDTDQIYPGRFLAETDAEDVARHAMEGVDPQFTGKFHKGDIIVAGKNFGCGSSREHAAITLKTVGAAAVIADSFARIFFRNGINMGLPLLTASGAAEAVKTGDTITVDLSVGLMTDQDTHAFFTLEPVTDYALKILQAGGIKPLLKARLAEEEKSSR